MEAERSILEGGDQRGHSGFLKVERPHSPLPLYKWHSRLTVEMKATGWERVNDNAGKINDIGPGHITIGNAP